MNHHVLFLFTFFLLRSVIFVRFISLIFFPCCCYHCHEQVKKRDKKRCNMCALIKIMQKFGVHTYLKRKQTIHMDMRCFISRLYSMQTKQTFEIICARVRECERETVWWVSVRLPIFVFNESRSFVIITMLLHYRFLMFFPLVSISMEEILWSRQLCTLYS